jgi:hypothetical protein
MSQRKSDSSDGSLSSVRLLDAPVGLEWTPSGRGDARTVAVLKVAIHDVSLAYGESALRSRSPPPDNTFLVQDPALAATLHAMLSRAARTITERFQIGFLHQVNMTTGVSELEFRAQVIGEPAAVADERETRQRLGELAGQFAEIVKDALVARGWSSQAEVSENWLPGALMIRHATAGEAETVATPSDWDRADPALKDRSSLTDRGELLRAATSPAWREHAVARAAELDFLRAWSLSHTERAAAAAEQIDAALGEHLDAAMKGGTPSEQRGALGRLKEWLEGSRAERVFSNLSAAELDLLRLAPLAYIGTQLPSVAARAQALPRDDPRRARVEEIVAGAAAGPLTENGRKVILAALQASNSELRRRVVRVRTFRNLLLIASVVLAALSLTLALIGLVWPDAVLLCFNRDTQLVCPTGVTSSDEAAGHPWDVATVEIVGLLAASVTAALYLRHVRGTSAPVSLPLAVAALKLPVGSLLAVLGILMLRTNAPALSLLDDSGAILAAAGLLGAAQGFVTRPVDRRADELLTGAATD